jgi:hypothetical protein
MSSWQGLSPLPRRLSSASVTILIRPPGGSDVILEDDPAILIADDDARSPRG